MFFISFIICIILSVIAVQPINADATATQINGQSSEKIYSEAGIIDKPPSKPNNVLSVKVESNLAKPLEQTSSNTTEPRHRGIKKTDDAPSLIKESENSNNTINSTINSNKNAAINKSNQTTASETANHSLLTGILPSQTASKIEQKSAISQSTQNTQNKIDDSKINTQQPVPMNTAKNSKATSTTTTTTTTTTIKPSTTSTTTKATTTTTTTKAPKKKPLITLSVEDVPGLLKAAEAQSQSQSGKEPRTDEVNEVPMSLQSSESYSDQKSSHNFVMLIIGLIVIVPFIVLITNCAVRRVRDAWSKRRYRRMDYLIEDMYN